MARQESPTTHAGSPRYLSERIRTPGKRIASPRGCGVEDRRAWPRYRSGNWSDWTPNCGVCVKSTPTLVRGAAHGCEWAHDTAHASMLMARAWNQSDWSTRHGTTQRRRWPSTPSMPPRCSPSVRSSISTAASRRCCSELSSLRRRITKWPERILSTSERCGEGKGDEGMREAGTGMA